MKKFLIGLFLFAIGFNSCITEKKRLKICNTCATQTFIKDSIVEKLIHDSIMMPAIEGPIQYLENPCKELCDSLGRLKNINVSSTKNGITTRIKTIGNSLAVTTNKNDTVYKFIYRTKEVYRKQKDVEIKCDKQHYTGWNGFCTYWFWITASLLFLFLLYICAKRYFKNIVPFIK